MGIGFGSIASMIQSVRENRERSKRRKLRNNELPETHREFNTTPLTDDEKIDLKFRVLQNELKLKRTGIITTILIILIFSFVITGIFLLVKCL